MTGHDHHDHHHGHDHDEPSELSETELRVRALQTILVEKGYADPAALDAIVETYETKIGPHIGARIVARARELGAIMADGARAESARSLKMMLGSATLDFLTERG